MSKLKINKKRGEFEVLLDKKQIVIVPSFLNIAEWEEETGKYWLQYVQDLSTVMKDRDKMSSLFGMIKAKDLITFFRIFSKEELGDVQIAELLDTCDLLPVMIQYAGAVVSSVAPRGIDEPEEVEKVKKPRKATVRKKT